MSKRILIVDDQEDIRGILHSLLTMKGYEVLEAADGLRGVTEATKYKPDLLILDVSMPRMSGFQTCQAIRKIKGCEKTPVIFLTAKKTDKDREFGARVGGDVYLTKPYNQNELLHEVARLLEAKAPDIAPGERPELDSSRDEWVG